MPRNLKEWKLGILLFLIKKPDKLKKPVRPINKLKNKSSIMSRSAFSGEKNPTIRKNAANAKAVVKTMPEI